METNNSLDACEEFETGVGERNKLSGTSGTFLLWVGQSFACLYVTAEIGAFLTGEQIHYVL